MHVEDEATAPANTRRQLTPYGLPGILSDIAQLIGVEPALALAEAFGGTRLNIPKTIPAAHRIAGVVGYENAQLVAPRWGGQLMRIPSAKAARLQLRVFQLRDEGLSMAKIALDCQISQRHVENLLRGWRPMVPAKTAPDGVPKAASEAGASHPGRSLLKPRLKTP
jgi:hypothetical protein